MTPEVTTLTYKHMIHALNQQLILRARNQAMDVEVLACHFHN